MRKIAALVVLLVASALVFMATAGASGEGSGTDLVYDCGPLTGEDCFGQRDMAGPSVGSVEYAQADNQGLKLWVRVAGADAGTPYYFNFWCGPTHDNPITLAASGSALRTNGNGYGRVSLWIGQADLSYYCGGGSHTGHLDLESGFSTLASGPIYFSARGDEVPR